MLVITAERLPHDTGTVLSEAPAPVACVSAIVFAGALPTDGHWKPGDPVHRVMILSKPELRAHVYVMMSPGHRSVLIGG